MKILILSDVPNGWIIDRNADMMRDAMPQVEFRKDYYCTRGTEELLNLALDVDLIHFLNWNCGGHFPAIRLARKPILISVRSHRYPHSVRSLPAAFHVQSADPKLHRDFPDATIVPDGVEDRFFKRPVIGFAGKPDGYKGFDLIEKACERLRLEFRPAAGDVPPSEMGAYYDSVDIVVCASEAEGSGTFVMEALARGKRVVSTRVGYSFHADIRPVVWVDRDQASIAKGIIQSWPWGIPNWEAVGERFEVLYGELVSHPERAGVAA